LRVILLSTSLVFATNNSSESANQTEQKDENSTIDNIKKVIQEKKTELGTVGANVRTQRPYLAKVTRVSEETLTVNNYTGNKIVPLNDEVLIQKKGKDIKVEEIVIDNGWVFTVKLLTIIEIQKVIVYDKDFTPKKKIITIGSIADMAKMT
jgi:CRISPR/Cas system CMR-associated protein Cmr3 (group 5 of RAMP superfamily)